MRCINDEIVRPEFYSNLRNRLIKDFTIEYLPYHLRNQSISGEFLSTISIISSFYPTSKSYQQTPYRQWIDSIITLLFNYFKVLRIFSSIVWKWRITWKMILSHYNIIPVFRAIELKIFLIESWSNFVFQ